MNDPIFLYNTLHRQKEIFMPIQPGTVGVYACGPTVYGMATIGNFRAYIFEDILRRTLEFAGLNVKHGMNITDVGHLVSDADEGEDKLEVGARREGVHPLEVARKYEAKFFEDFTAFNCKMPHQVVRATDAIDDQIKLIQELEKKGYTYQDKQAIYFDTSKLSDYGKLTGQKVEDKLVGAREDVVVDANKRNPQDFALWFFLAGRYESHILHWPSPWGEGFPGWHIECSAISRQILGQPFDIHTGGVDHIGTHHTNEIAQSEAAFNEPLAHIWMHNEFLMVEGQKMSKSLGNLITLDVLREKGFSALDFRYLCLMAHYRSKMNFTWESLEGARQTRLNLVQQIALTAQGDLNEDAVQEKHEIWRKIADDLDTPGALGLLHQYNNPKLWLEFDAVLGLGLGKSLHIEGLGDEFPHELELFVKYKVARSNKDYATSDKLRQELEASGWKIIDTPEGSHIFKVG